MFNKRFLLLLVTLIIPITLAAQRPGKQVRNAEKKAEKVETQQKKAYAKARKKELKHRYEIQNKDVQERMKQSKKEADRNNRRKKEPFLKRIFKKRRR